MIRFVSSFEVAELPSPWHPQSMRLGLDLGIDAADDAPLIAGAGSTSRRYRECGRARETRRSLQLRHRARQSPIGAPAAFRLACEVKLNSGSAIRLQAVHDRQNVIKAATPSATPTSETQVMNDTKKLCSRPTNSAGPRILERLEHARH